MFNIFTDAIDNAMDVAGSILDGEDVSRRKVAKLASDAIEIATGAFVVSEGLDALKRLLNEGEP